MRNVANFIGRLLLLIAGVLMILAAVFEIIASINTLNSPDVGWWNWGNQQAVSAFVLLVMAGLEGIAGLTAFFAALRGRRSFFLAVFSLLLIALPIYSIVTRVQAGTLTANWDQIWKLIVQFATPIMYFVGCLLLVRRN